MISVKDHHFMQEAIQEAEKSLEEGGMPIGSVLVKNDEIVGRGHNQLLQKGSVILHAEMNCLESAGRLHGSDYLDCTLYTTLSPCPMCSGMLILYKIPRVIIGENSTLQGPERLLEENGVEVINLALPECQKMLEDYITGNKEVWDVELERVGYTTDLK
jgi:tRNA(Arg) A34 adenosine deaminase TadA